MDKLTSFLIITSAILIALGVLGAIIFVGHVVYNGGGIFPLIIYALLILGFGAGGND